MHDVVFILHLVGLMMGAGGGFGSMILARAALKAPADQAMTLRRLGPTLGRFSTIGLALMWLTGLTLVWVSYGGFSNLPPLFWAKLIFVLSLTIAALTFEITYAQIKGGKVQAATRLPVLGPIAGLSSLLSVIFAVLAFH